MPENKNELALRSDAQAKKILAMCSELHIADDLRHSLINTITEGRTKSTKDLTKTDASKVIEHLATVDICQREDDILPPQNNVPVKHFQIESVNIQSLISRALESSSPIDVMERLMDMRRELRAEQARDSFYYNLSGFQSECPVIPKNKQVIMGGVVRYSYAPLEVIVSSVKDILNKYGFSYYIQTRYDTQNIVAICIVNHRDGHSISTELPAVLDLKAAMNESQRVASALTYARRYAFCNAFGILTGDDDDDARASDPKNAAGQKSKPGQGQDKNVFDDLMSKLSGATTLAQLRWISEALKSARNSHSITNAEYEILAKLGTARKAIIPKPKSSILIAIKACKTQKELDDVEQDWADSTTKSTPEQDDKIRAAIAEKREFIGDNYETL